MQMSLCEKNNIGLHLTLCEPSRLCLHVNVSRTFEKALSPCLRVSTLAGQLVQGLRGGGDFRVKKKNRTESNNIHVTPVPTRISKTQHMAT